MEELNVRNICDAHVHMGYYTRAGYADPFYYSPQRVFGMLSRCGVDEFIVSTTNSQVAGISLDDILREAREMRRVAGRRAHQLLWLSGRILDVDTELRTLDTGLYEGMKLHGVETPWITERHDDLRRVFDAVAERGMIVQLHTGCDKCCHPYEWGGFARDYPMVKMDFAHCRPIEATLDVMRSCPNVFSDISFLHREEIVEAISSDVADRVMFGSDFPAYHSQADCPFAQAYRERLFGLSRVDMKRMRLAFKQFVSQ